MSERSKEHASKACEGKPSASSNLASSAKALGFHPRAFLYLHPAAFGADGLMRGTDTMPGLGCGHAVCIAEAVVA